MSLVYALIFKFDHNLNYRIFVLAFLVKSEENVDYFWPFNQIYRERDRSITVRGQHGTVNDAGYKDDSDPVQTNAQPSRCGQEEEPGLCVQVLVGVKLCRELLLHVHGPDGV